MKRPLTLLRAILPLALGATIAGLGWRRGALSADGAVAATAVGAATFGFGGLPASVALVAFFVSGSALSRRRAVTGEIEAAKGHRRDAVQVFANGGIAALGLALHGLGWRPGRGAALGALAAAAADTWASEIGVRSPWPPRSVVSGQVVRPGTSGGVTPLGWGASVAGALVVGVAWDLADRRIHRSGSWVRPGVLALGVALASGLAGSLADSVAGASLQASYACSVCGHPAEAPILHCDEPVQLVRGHRWITNDVVNVIGTASGALVGAGLGAWVTPRS